MLHFVSSYLIRLRLRSSYLASSTVLEHSQKELARKSLEKQFAQYLARNLSLYDTPKIILQVCDHGGQEDFFATSATFASSGCVCIMTFNVTEELEAEAHSFSRQTDGDRIKRDELKLHRMRRNIDWINHHLSVISVSQKPDGGHPSSEASSAASSDTERIGHTLGCCSPPVIFAATHADLVERGNETMIRSREVELERAFGNKEFYNHVYHRPSDKRSKHFFCIDNTKSHPSDEEDSEVVELRQLIVSAIEQYGTEHLTLVTWLLLEDEIYIMRQDPMKKKIIALQEIVAVAREKCSLMSESEVIPALNHLHELHVVMYFATCSELKHCVFIDAPWVFSTLSRLNSLKCLVPIQEGRFRNDVYKLQQEGIMSDQLCFHLLANLDGDELPEGDRILMVKAAEELDILTECKSIASDDKAHRGERVRGYFAPGALQEDDDHVPPSTPRRGVPNPVHLVLRPENVGMFIEALFFRLLIRCVRHYSSKQPYLRRNHAIFHLRNGCLIELFYVYEYVIVVMRPNFKLSDKDIKESCVEIREFIVSQLEDVKKQGLAGFQFSVCFQHLTATEKPEPFVPIREDCLVRLDDTFDPEVQMQSYINSKPAFLTEEDQAYVAMWFSSYEKVSPVGSVQFLTTKAVDMSCC